MGKGKGGGKGGKNKQGKGPQSHRANAKHGGGWKQQKGPGGGQESHPAWAMVERVKEYQRSEEGCAAWRIFCQQHNNGRRTGFEDVGEIANLLTKYQPPYYI